MIILTNEDKAFDKIQHPFMIKKKKPSQHSGNRENTLQCNKGHIWQTHSQYHTQWAKTASVPLKIGNKTGLSDLTFLFNRVVESLATAIRQEEIKGIQIGKEEVKLSLFADGMILYIENLKDFTKKLLELTNEFSQVAGYKINIQKSVEFLHWILQWTNKKGN